MCICFISLCQRALFLVLIASNNCRLQPPQPGCVTGWAQTPNTPLGTLSHSYANSSLPSLPAEFMMTEPPGNPEQTHPPTWQLPLLTRSWQLTGAASTPSPLPVSMAWWDLSLLPSCQCSGLEHPGAAVCCTLSCASNDCHGVTLLTYTHPSHLSGCIF